MAGADFRAEDIARATSLHLGDWTQPVTDNAQSAQAADLILTEEEVARRVLLLTELRHAISGYGVCGVLTRNHRIVLRYPTDGAVFRLASGGVFAAANPAAAAREIWRARCTA